MTGTATWTNGARRQPPPARVLDQVLALALAASDFPWVAAMQMVGLREFSPAEAPDQTVPAESGGACRRRLHSGSPGLYTLRTPEGARFARQTDRGPRSKEGDRAVAVRSSPSVRIYWIAHPSDAMRGPRASTAKRGRPNDCLSRISNRHEFRWPTRRCRRFQRLRWLPTWR